MFDVWRIYRVAVLLVVLGCALAGRLFYLQFAEGHKLAMDSLGIRTQVLALDVARGNIEDRHGQLLTNIAQGFSVIVFPQQIHDMAGTAARLAAVMGNPAESLAKKIAEQKSPFHLTAAVDERVAHSVEELKLPGVVVVVEHKRYGYQPLAAHVIGYVNMADNMGVSGIEAQYDDSLKGGQTEYAAAILDAGRHLIPGLGYKYLYAGDMPTANNVVLTLDNRMQKIVEEVMDKNMVKGAVVVLRPSTGEVLAMASRPDFDPNHIADYLHRDSAPLINRALAGYQPGSVFKLVVAAAALENHLVRPEDDFFDSGYIDVDGLRFYGWDYEEGGSGRGHITFTDALAYSSNPTFIHVGLSLGAERLTAFAAKLGFGHITKLGLKEESAGNLPSPVGLYPGELANLSIGQGKLEATPLQIASLVAAIVNDGIQAEPRIVDRITAADGTVLSRQPGSAGLRVFSVQTARQLRQMMMAVTRYGTGKAAYVEDGGSAGKTGSAETGRLNKSGSSVNHAWFAGYAPVAAPRYAAVVFVEEGMSGADVAAPIFRDIMTRILAMDKAEK